MNKLIKYTTIMLVFFLCSCANRKNINNSDFIVANLKAVGDTYSFSNAIYEVEKEAHPDKEPYHSRQLEVKYTIKNETDNIVFMPFNTLSNDTCYSHLNVWFQSDSTQVKPFYTVIRFPCNSVYINPGDSINLTLRFFRFPDWQIKGCDVHTHSTKLISMLKVEYIADSLDINKYKSKYGITKLKFNNAPKKFAILEDGMPFGWNM